MSPYRYQLAYGHGTVDESYPEARTDEAGRVRDWSYDGTGMLSGATELGAAVPWGYAYEMHRIPSVSDVRMGRPLG